MEPIPQLPHSKSSTNPRLKQLESELSGGKSSPEKALEYTKELLKDIAKDKLSEQEKKKEHDLAIKAMIEWSEKKFAKNLQLNTLILKLNLLRVRHLFTDFKRRMLSVIQEKKREEEDRLDEKQERREEEELREQERKREAEQAFAQAESNHKTEAPKEAAKPALTPQENADDMTNNISDLTDLMCGLIKMTGGGSLFSDDDKKTLHGSMLELDTIDLSPEEFEKKLFEMVDHVDLMFNKARANFLKADQALLDVCYMRIGKDLTKWLSTGQLPRYTPEDHANIQNTMQNVKLHPVEHGKILQTLRGDIAHEIVAMREYQAAPQAPIRRPPGTPTPSAQQPAISVPGQAQTAGGPTVPSAAVSSEGPSSEKRPTLPKEFDPRATPSPKQGG